MDPVELIWGVSMKLTEARRMFDRMLEFRVRPAADGARLLRGAADGHYVVWPVPRGESARLTYVDHRLVGAVRLLGGEPLREDVRVPKYLFPVLHMVDRMKYVTYVYGFAVERKFYAWGTYSYYVTYRKAATGKRWGGKASAVKMITCNVLTRGQQQSELARNFTVVTQLDAAAQWGARNTLSSGNYQRLFGAPLPQAKSNYIRWDTFQHKALLDFSWMDPARGALPKSGLAVDFGAIVDVFRRHGEIDDVAGFAVLPYKMAPADRPPYLMV